MATRWYVLVSKANKEETVLRLLESRGYPIFYPKYMADGARSGKPQRRAYFPGYIFVKLDLKKDSVSTFQWMPNTDGLVCFGLKPAFVPDHLVEAIQRHTLARAAELDGKTVSKAGDCDQEPANFVGSVEEIVNPYLSSKARVRELLQLLQGLTVSSALSD